MQEDDSDGRRVFGALRRREWRFWKWVVEILRMSDEMVLPRRRSKKMLLSPPT